MRQLESAQGPSHSGINYWMIRIELIERKKNGGDKKTSRKMLEEMLTHSIIDDRNKARRLE